MGSQPAAHLADTLANAARAELAAVRRRRADGRVDDLGADQRGGLDRRLPSPAAVGELARMGEAAAAAYADAGHAVIVQFLAQLARIRLAAASRLRRADLDPLEANLPHSGQPSLAHFSGRQHIPVRRSLVGVIRHSPVGIADLHPLAPSLQAATSAAATLLRPERLAVNPSRRGALTARRGLVTLRNA